MDEYDGDALLTLTQAAQHVGQYKQLVYSWTLTGRLRMARRSADGRPLYRASDVTDAERQTRNSPHSRRAPRTQAA